jgi:hypothetical protein
MIKKPRFDGATRINEIRSRAFLLFSVKTGDSVNNSFAFLKRSRLHGGITAAASG